jgi:hypothetical protein
MHTLDDLALATRHVADGERRIRAQRALVARLEGHGLPTGQANSLLGVFLVTLGHMQQHMRAIEEDMDRPAGP